MVKTEVSLRAEDLRLTSKLTPVSVRIHLYWYWRRTRERLTALWDYNAFRFVDACLSNPCRSGAKCVPQGNDYKCDCPSGFQGKNCDRVMDAGIECDFKDSLCYFNNDGRAPLRFRRLFSSRKYAEVWHNVINSSSTRHIILQTALVALT